MRSTTAEVQATIDVPLEKAFEHIVPIDLKSIRWRFMEEKPHNHPSTVFVIPRQHVDGRVKKIQRAL